MDVPKVKNLVHQYADVVQRIIGEIDNNPAYVLSSDQASHCQECRNAMRDAYSSLTPEEKLRVNKKVEELSAEHGALSTYSDQSDARYAHDLLTAFDELLNS